MKATITFELPEEAEDHLRCLKSMNLCASLWDFDQWLRDEIKYRNKDYQDIRDRLHFVMEDNDVNLEELYS